MYEETRVALHTERDYIAVNIDHVNKRSTYITIREGLKEQVVMYISNEELLELVNRISRDLEK